MSITLRVPFSWFLAVSGTCVSHHHNVGSHTQIDLAVEYCESADINGDDAFNSGDIQSFVDCALTGSGGDCECADLNNDGVISSADANQFVSALLAG